MARPRLLALLLLPFLLLTLKLGFWQSHRLQEKLELRRNADSGDAAKAQTAQELVAKRFYQLENLEPIPQAQFALRQEAGKQQLVQLYQFEDDALPIVLGEGPLVKEGIFQPFSPLPRGRMELLILPLAESGLLPAGYDHKTQIAYALDIPAVEALTGQTVLPFFGLSKKAAEGLQAVHYEPLPPERHLGYAVTWFGLAAVLFAAILWLLFGFFFTNKQIKRNDD